MSNIIPFESGNLPAYLKSVDVATLNADLTAHAGTGGFPVISIKGKVFAIVRDGERKILPNPKDPDSAATSIDVVMVKVNKGTSKVFYAKGYTEGENAKPDCYSNTGDKPDASIEKPQSKQCATCQHNQWGSKIGEGGGKGKACQDSVRMAIAAPDMINDPFLLRVPAASIRALGEYGDMLKKRGVGYTMVLTKIGFDIEAPTPKLTFKPVGMIDDKMFAQVQEMQKADVVKNILGGGFTPSEVAADAPSEVDRIAQSSKVAPSVSKSKTVTEDEVKTAVAAAPAPKKEEVSVDLDLDSLKFDD